MTQAKQKLPDYEPYGMENACETALNSELPVKVGAVVYGVLHKAPVWPTYDSWCSYSYGHNTHEVHAEIMALKDIEFKPNIKYKPTIFITKAPCLNCCGAIVKANIKRVVCPEPYAINTATGKPSKWIKTQKEGLHYLKQNGVTVDFVEVVMRDGIPYTS